jgi:hypothetical protein
MGHAQPSGRGALKGGYRLAENKLLLLKYRLDRIQQLPVERAVLAFEVQHGDGLDRWSGIADRGAGSNGSVFHLIILSAAQGFVSSRSGSRVLCLLSQKDSGKGVSPSVTVSPAGCCKQPVVRH